MDSNTKAGTVSGVIMVLLFKANTAELVSTILLAAIGATVSFGVSMLLKLILKRFTRK